MGDGRHALDGVYRLCRLLAGGADCPSLLRAMLQEALALTGSAGGAIFLLEPERRVLRAFFREGAGWPEGTEVLADAPGWHVAVCEGRMVRFLQPAQPAVPADATAGRNALVLPLLARGNVLGVLALQDPQARWQQALPACSLETLANLAAHALQHAALAHDLLRQQEEICTLIEVGQDISASLDLDEVLRRVVRQATQLMRARMGSLMLVDERLETFRIRATYGASQTYTQRSPLAIAESLIGNVVCTGTPIAVLDVRQHAQYQCLEMARQEGLCSLLSVPLKTATRVIGVLNVYTTERRRFRKDEAEFLSAMAAQSATAIENAQLYQTMLATQERLRQSECLAALGSMSAGLAHEIRNPLHTMQLLASAMQQDYPPHSPLWADVEVMQNEIRRLTLLVEQFLDFARPKSPQVTCLKLHEIMEDTLLLVGAEARRRGITLHKHWPHDLPIVWIDAAQLKQVFLNVLLNALQAMPSGGAIDVYMDADAQTITTRVQDQGEGIPAAIYSQLFTPFFTTKPQGTGLGLAISQRIIEGHGGCIRITSQPGEGTAVHIVLPLIAVEYHEENFAGR